MKMTTKIKATFLALALTLSGSPTFSMDVTEKDQSAPVGLSSTILLPAAGATAQAEPAQPKMSDTLPVGIQTRLTEVGHTVLKSIYQPNGFDSLNSGLFDAIYPQLKPFLADAQYSKFAGWRPSNLVRWAFSSTDKEYITKRKNHMIAIIAVSWAITDLAKRQNEFFERGSCSLIDPGHRLTKFLLDYVILTTGYEDPQKLPFALTVSNFAYRRDPSLYGSSHHYGRCPESQFGIDVRFEPTDVPLKFLPFDRTHDLFAKLDVGGQEEPLLFFKMEPIGMGSVLAMGAHGVKLAESKQYVPSEARREKDIKEPIGASFQELQLEAGIMGEFKTIRAMYLEARRLLIQTVPAPAIVEEAAVSPVSLVKLNDSVVPSALGAFIPVPQVDAPQKTKNIHDKARAFMDTVDGIYPYGHNHLRIGNEVIINLNRLL